MVPLVKPLVPMVMPMTPLATNGIIGKLTNDTIGENLGRSHCFAVLLIVALPVVILIMALSSSPFDYATHL